MLPKKTGVSGIRRVYGDEAAGPPLKRLKGGASLKDLLAEYVFFTYAPLVIYGGLDFNPVQEWINLAGHKQVVYIMTFDLPLFDMKGNPKFDRTLWAVEKEHWPALSLHIGSLAIIDKKNKTLVRVLCQEIPIVDAGAFEKLILADVLPSVTVTTFSVDSNKECIAFEPSKDLLIRPPGLKLYEPREETIKLAAGMFANATDPYRGVQPLPWEQYESSSPPAETK